MEDVSGYVSGGSIVLLGVVSWQVKRQWDEIISLRKYRHDHANHITGLQGEMADVKRRLDKMGNGDR